MRRDLDYYLNLPYKIELSRIPAEEGGGYMATLPDIGRLAITGDGDTIEEAIRNLEDQKRERFADYLERGVHIPEPITTKEHYSGRFVVRVPKRLHRELVEQARKEGVSLNHLITYLLSAGLREHTLGTRLDHVESRVDSFRQTLCRVTYQYPGLHEVHQAKGMEKSMDDDRVAAA